MLFHSSVRRELARNFGGTALVLITIVGTMMLIRTLSQASSGMVDSKDLALVLGYTMMGYLPIILSLSLFISIVGTLSRMYQDHEMDIWLSAGQGLFGFLRPAYRFSWPILLMIGTAALVVWPWGNQQISDLRERFERRGDLERVAPGQFQESASGQRVFFIDKSQVDDKSGKNIFISSTEGNKESVTTAREGKLSTLGVDRFLVLLQGQRVETTKTQDKALTEPPGTLKISEFEEYGTKIKDNVSLNADNRMPKTISTLELLNVKTPTMLGELSWRIGLLLIAVNLVVLALAVAAVNPRASRSSNLVFALFTFLIYYNLINIGVSWIASGKMQILPFLLALHGGALAFSLLWLYKRHSGFSVKALLLGLARGRSNARAVQARATP